MATVGLDIGGANLKASDGDAKSLSRPFRMWERPEQLAAALQEILGDFADVDRLAVTMTGELADCFDSKVNGVDRILNAVEHMAEGRPVGVWQTVGEFVSPDVARAFPLLTSAANWHALATWAGRAAPDGNSLLIDVGSTTTDVIPLEGGIPMPQGRTDVERLRSGELVYSGVRRTPLSAIARSVPFRGGSCPLASEFFATTQDVYIWLGDLAENADSVDTPDGKPATRRATLVRLARMLCCDLTGYYTEDADAMAGFLADVQRQQIAACVDRVVRRMPEECRLVVISGEGEFLARRTIATPGRFTNSAVTSLANTIGPEHSRAACAWALAQLGNEGRFH